MRKFCFLFSIFLAIFLFLGAGCTQDQTQNKEKNNTVNQEMESDNTARSEQNENENNQTDKKKKNELQLEAEARGEGKVHFNWSIPEDIEADKFVIVRDEKANPTNDGKNYWFRQPPTRRDVTWIDIPSGEYHFRICIQKDGDCTRYSNDVKVEVK